MLSLLSAASCALLLASVGSNTPCVVDDDVRRGAAGATDVVADRGAAGATHVGAGTAGAVSRFPMLRCGGESGAAAVVAVAAAAALTMLDCLGRRNGDWDSASTSPSPREECVAVDTRGCAASSATASPVNVSPEEVRPSRPRSLSLITRRMLPSSRTSSCWPARLALLALLSRTDGRSLPKVL